MISIKNVSYTYQPSTPFEHRALSNINLEIPSGTLTALIGHTGSGKSTLTQLISALMKPTQGSIIIDGVDITDKKTDLRKIHQSVGIVFQYPEHQLFEETVEKDIAFGPVNMGLSEEEVKERILRAANLVGLKEKHLKKSPFDLSGGQKRRAAMAGVLAMEPKVLILDEPTAGLDPKGRDHILEIIKNLHLSHKDMIIIFVSHSMEDVAKTADNIIVMNEGKIEMQGSVAEIFTKSKRLKEIGLNVPQITLLADKLKEAGVNLPEHIYTVKYAANAIADLIKGGGENV